MKIRIPEFKYDLRVTQRETIYISYTPAQNERIIIKPETIRIYKDYFPELNGSVCIVAHLKLNTVFRSWSLDYLCEVEHAIAGNKTVGLKNKFKGQIIKIGVWQAIRISSGLYKGNFANP
ncbi:MAG TPA: hypothetical protein VH815_03360 [Acidobacteriota bacterium]